MIHLKLNICHSLPNMTFNVKSQGNVQNYKKKPNWTIFVSAQISSYLWFHLSDLKAHKYVFYGSVSYMHPFD